MLYQVDKKKPTRELKIGDETYEVPNITSRTFVLFNEDGKKCVGSYGDRDLSFRKELDCFVVESTTPAPLIHTDGIGFYETDSGHLAVFGSHILNKDYKEVSEYGKGKIYSLPTT